MASRQLLVILAGSLLASTPAWGASPFDGDWVADLGTQGGLPMDIYLVRNGRYTCTSCEPPRSYLGTAAPSRFPAKMA